jgi:hypothetical protein
MGLELADPLTFISDILMAVFCAFLGHRLYHDFKSKYAKLTAYFFLFLGVSAFLGGASHLLDLYLGKPPHLIAWTLQGISILFFQLASLRLIRSSRIKFFLRAVIFSFFGIFIAQIYSVQHFDVVKVNSIVGLIGFVSFLHIYKYFETSNKSYLRIPLAIILFAMPAMIHSFGIYFNKWIDQNVISHLLLLPCYYLLYSAVKQVAMLKKKTQPRPQSVPLEGK